MRGAYANTDANAWVADSDADGNTYGYAETHSYAATAPNAASAPDTPLMDR